MKKTLALTSALICFLILGGCANTVQETEQPPLETNESLISTSGRSSGVPDPWTLTEPPELFVSTEYNADRITAQCSSYEWNVKLEGDMMSSIIACGPHPLDSPKNMDYPTLYTAFPAESLTPSEEGETKETVLPVFYLDFGEIPPETVTVYRWPAAFVFNASEHYEDGEPVAVDSSDGFILLPQGDGEFVYEIHADWGLMGHAYYSFLTMPEVRDEP